VSGLRVAQHTGEKLLYSYGHLALNRTLLSSMVGALNKLPVAASGMIFFGDAVTFGSVSAVGVGFLAGVLYAVAKNMQKKENKAEGETILPLSNRKA
jgi:hypothetical protein